MPTAPIVEKEGQLQSFGAPQLSYLPKAEGVGQGLENFGKQLGEVARVAKERGDTVALLDASSQLDTWKQQNIYGENGMLSKKGKSAIGIPNAIGSQFDNDMQAISQKLGNDDQRLRFQQLAQSQKSSIMDLSYSHERKELDAYGKSVWKGKQESGLDLVEANYDNQQAVDSTISDLQNANTSYQQKEGTSDEEIASQNHDIAVKGYIRALGKKAVADPDGFLESIKDGSDAEAVATKPGQARGVRNNNPGNLRDSGDDWQGKKGVDKDGYLQFNSAADGLRAMAVNLKNQQTKHGLTTLNQIIDKYAPPTENDTEAYKAQAAKSLGIDGDRPINLQDPQMLAQVMTFMVKKENGNQPYPAGSITTAANVALDGSTAAPKEIQVADASGRTVPSETTPTPATPLGGPTAPGKPDAPAALAEPAAKPVSGNKMFDALPFQYQHQLVRMAEAEVSKSRVKFRADVDKRAKDSLAMSQDGVNDNGVAPTAEEYNKAYGYDDGPQKFKEYQDLRNTATAINDVAVQTPAQQTKTLEENKPKAGEGYALQDAKYKALETAVVQVNKQRADDPISFAQRYGLAPKEPLQLNSPKQLAQQLPVRSAVTDQMHKTYGTPLMPLTKGEATALSGALNEMTPKDQLAYFQNFHTGLSDPRMYMAAMGQIRPDSPVTAVAGAFVGLDGSQVVAEHTFSANQSVTPMTVAQRLVEGEALLNPTKFDKKDDGKPSGGKGFPMPPDGNDDSAKGLRPIFNQYVGDSFRGMPDAANVAYQSFRAYYAAEAARRGVYGGVLNEEIAGQSVRAVVGNVVEKGEGHTVAPWGMDDTTFLDNAKTDFDSIVKEQGFDAKKVKWDAITLENTGNPGEYRAKIGSGYLVNKEGQPMVISAWSRKP